MAKRKYKRLHYEDRQTIEATILLQKRGQYMDEKTIQRIKKLQALAERGVGGEKTTAQKKLAKLLKDKCCVDCNFIDQKGADELMCLAAYLAGNEQARAEAQQKAGKKA